MENFIILQGKVVGHPVIYSTIFRKEHTVITAVIQVRITQSQNPKDVGKTYRFWAEKYVDGSSSLDLWFVVDVVYSMVMNVGFSENDDDVTVKAELTRSGAVASHLLGFKNMTKGFGLL